MRYRQLGQSGLTVSVVGLGCNNFGRRLDAGQTRLVVDAAVDAGITFFDTADTYGESGTSEAYLGEALQGHRQNVSIGTKFGNKHRARPDVAPGSRQNIRRAVEDSLRRLRTDYIDLYQLHFPDPRTPIDETLTALDELVRDGKVRYLGGCNFDAWQVVEADWIARGQRSARFISAQNRYNVLNRAPEAELTPACLRYGIGIIPFSPLADGILTGKYRRGEDPPAGTRLASGRGGVLNDRVFDAIDALSAYARERGIGLLDVAIGGLAARPAVGSVIAGATTAEQARANAAAGEWTPSAADLDSLERTLTEAAP
ncbi:MAG TPA: aldo/keto reductase [Chloroflexota bacterium]|nr:aldo/keto reductase [Chloroflexota bacterium]